jgi:hypothetical protein
MAPARGLTYAVDIVFCIDVTGSMTPIIDKVKANALRFYDDVQANLTAKGKNVDQLRVRVLAFRDFEADGASALQESPFFELPSQQGGFSEFVNGPHRRGWGRRARVGSRGGVARHQLAVDDDRRPPSAGDRGVDRPAGAAPRPVGAPADLTSRVPRDFSALTDLWENEQGPMGSSSKRLILFAPTGPAGATSPACGRTWCTTRPRPAAASRTSTTARSSTRSATRCDGPPRSAAAGCPLGPAVLGPTVSFSFNLGKIPDQGEDADPILRDGRDLALVGVFDGMGGAGGTVYETPDGPRTGAYLASRLARDVVERRMVELLEPDWYLDGRAAAEDLRRSMKAALLDRLDELNAPKSGLRSRLLRALPTTMALVASSASSPAATAGRATSSGPGTPGPTCSTATAPTS